MNPLPETIAIAGAWGYIGRKFVDAARALGVRTLVHDPGPVPDDLDLSTVERIDDESAFYRAKADLFHLAVHPEHRRRGESLLLERSARERILILNEKPMAAPEHPERCSEIVEAVERTGAVMLYDFPELYDALTASILDYLSGFRHVEITELSVCRSKDREDPGIPRNYKRMVTIQYQESVHCLAFVVYVLARLRGDLESVFERGISISGQSEPYDPPNPEIYAQAVDGRCRYTIEIAGTRVEGLTDFKRHASWAKRRVIVGIADGKPFRIEADYLEDGKQLRIDGADQRWDPGADSYRQVITTATGWYRQVSRDRLMHGIYPNPAFARITYQLSSVLWRSCKDARSVRLTSLDELLAFDAGFRRGLPSAS